MELRELKKEELETFIELRIRQLLEEGAEETTDLRPALWDYYTRHGADGSFFALTAVENGELVGTAALSIVEKPPYFGCSNGKIGLLSSVYVRPSHRRRGIATALLEGICAKAREAGCSVIQITASEMGVLLYTSCGFQKNPNFMQLRL